MNNTTLNSILKWIGRLFIGAGFAGGALWTGSKWGNACDKATAENRLVGEKNAERVTNYVEKKILPQTADSLAKAAAQRIDKSLNASPQKDE